MEKAKKSIEQMAKEANGRSRARKDCSLFMDCNKTTQKICSDAFIEGYKKGYEKGRGAQDIGAYLQKVKEENV